MNRLKVLVFRLFFLLAILDLAGCGAMPNLFSALTPKKDIETFESLLTLAKSAYDRGKYDKALKYGKKAYEIDPDSEELSVLIGYIYLSLAGIGPFDLAKKLMELEEEKKSGQDSSKTSGSKDTADVLTSLRSVVGLSKFDLEQMGTRDISDPELPLMLPKCAEEVRGLVDTLMKVNMAISYVCRFVIDDVKIAEDPRHRCSQYTGRRRETDKAHFLWAFAHLTEALSFHSVLLYSGDASTGKESQSNLEKRMKKVTEQPVTDYRSLSTFATQIENMERIVSSILPISGDCSETWPTHQMTALLRDMLVVSNTFARIPGVPEKITSAITASMDKISSLSKSASGDQAKSEQSKAMKGQFTKNVSKELNSKLGEVEQMLGPDISETERRDVDRLCSSLDTISGGSTEGQDKPALCTAY